MFGFIFFIQTRFFCNSKSFQYSFSAVSPILDTALFCWFSGDHLRCLESGVQHQRHRNARSGLDGGYSSLDMKSGISCFGVLILSIQVLRPAGMRRLHRWTKLTHISSKSALKFVRDMNFNAWGTKINLVRWSLDTSTQTSLSLVLCITQCNSM